MRAETALEHDMHIRAIVQSMALYYVLVAGAVFGRPAMVQWVWKWRAKLTSSPNRISVNTPVIIIDRNQTSVSEMLRTTLGAITNITNILICIPHIIASKLAGISIIIRSPNLNTATKSFSISPAMPSNCDRIASCLYLRAAVHIVDGLVAPFLISRTAESCTLAVV